jgi:basic membrane protein A
MTGFVGKLLAGRYQVIKQQGAGGMATVYHAHDLRLDRDVAIKLIRTDQNDTDDFLKRFDREARSLARFSHANIVKIYDYGEEDGKPYLVMEYVPGGALTERLGKPVPYQQAARWLAPLARAVDYAHRRGVIHRDIKPSNILVNELGDLMLSDFGIARMQDAQPATGITRTGSGVGTPDYMAPEQWLGQVVAQSDIYALGVVFFELIAGVRPYTADTPAAIFLKHLQEPIPSVRRVIPDLPEQVETVIFKVLAKKPEDRYADMAAFAEALEQLALGAGEKETALHQIPAGPELPQTVSPPSVPVQTQITPARSTQVQPPAPETLPSESLMEAAAVGPAAASAQRRRGPLPWLALSGVGLLVLLAALAVLIAPGLMPKPIPTAARMTAAVLQPTSTSVPSLPPVPTSTDAAPTATALPAVGGMPDCASLAVYCVGLVTDVGKVDDRSFNQSTWEGVQKAQNELGIQAKFIETTDSKDYAKNISVFADAKYDLIVTVGFNLAETTTAAAKRYPTIRFIGVDQLQSEPLANLTGLVFPEDQAGFLVGALAAWMSKSGKIGAVLATDAVPPVWRFGEGFRAGANYARADINVHIVYHNDVGFDKTFIDPEWGKTTAIAMIDKGVDVVFGAGGKTGNGVLYGCAEKNVMAIGVDTDQYFTVPEAQKVLLSSAMKLLSPGTYHLIQMAKAGTIPVGNFTGEVGYAPFHELAGTVPADVAARLEEMVQGFANGSLKTGVPPSKPN